jgi:lipopolysaccharide transport system ATP-binding protein
MEGGSFDVTREYLTYHEEKNNKGGAEVRRAEGGVPKIVRTWTERDDGTAAATFRQGEVLVLQGTVYEPDDRPPVVLFGIVRVDGTSVYGSHSNETPYRPARIAPREFGFAVRFEALCLLPGKYHLRVHTLDAEGLRLFDTVETDFVVTGETRDYGIVGLPHRWLPGRAADEASTASRETSNE